MSVTKPWHEDDAFWETWMPFMFSPHLMSVAPKQVDEILTLIKIPSGAHVLDLACGAGRHSLDLVRRGFHVTGVDRTSVYLKAAGEQARKEGLNMEFVHQDMRDFYRPGEFDAAINMSTSFGYFEDPRDDALVMNNICRSLKRGGVFLLETVGKEVLARIYQARDWNEMDGVYMLQERRVTHNWSRMENRWILFKGGRRFESSLDHRLFSATELVALFVESGFVRVEAFGGTDGTPYDNNAKRLVVVGHKE